MIKMNLTKADLKTIGTISRKMSDLARRWPNDAESNRLAALSEKILLVPKVKLDKLDIDTLQLYLQHMEKSKQNAGSI